MNTASSAPAGSRKHPKTGLISFGLAVVTGLLTLLLLVAAFIPETGTYTAARLNKILFVFALIIAPVFHLAGLILGIVGAFAKDSKKVFSILGMVFNSLPLILAIIVWIFIILIALAVIGTGGGWM